MTQTPAHIEETEEKLRFALRHRRGALFSDTMLFLDVPDGRHVYLQRNVDWPAEKTARRVPEGADPQGLDQSEYERESRTAITGRFITTVRPLSYREMQEASLIPAGYEAHEALLEEVAPGTPPPVPIVLGSLEHDREAIIAASTREGVPVQLSRLVGGEPRGHLHFDTTLAALKEAMGWSRRFGLLAMKDRSEAAGRENPVPSPYQEPPENEPMRRVNDALEALARYDLLSEYLAEELEGPLPEWGIGDTTYLYRAPGGLEEVQEDEEGDHRRYPLLGAIEDEIGAGSTRVFERDVSLDAFAGSMFSPDESRIPVPGSDDEPDDYFTANEEVPPGVLHEHGAVPANPLAVVEYLVGVAPEDFTRSVTLGPLPFDGGGFRRVVVTQEEDSDRYLVRGYTDVFGEPALGMEEEYGGHWRSPARNYLDFDTPAGERNAGEKLYDNGPASPGGLIFMLASNHGLHAAWQAKSTDWTPPYVGQPDRLHASAETEDEEEREASRIRVSFANTTGERAISLANLKENGYTEITPALSKNHLILDFFFNKDGETVAHVVGLDMRNEEDRRTARKIADHDLTSRHAYVSDMAGVDPDGPRVLLSDAIEMDTQQQTMDRSDEDRSGNMDRSGDTAGSPFDESRFSASLQQREKAFRQTVDNFFNLRSEFTDEEAAGIREAIEGLEAFITITFAEVQGERAGADEPDDVHPRSSEEAGESTGQTDPTPSEDSEPLPSGEVAGGAEPSTERGVNARNVAKGIADLDLTLYPPVRLTKSERRKANTRANNIYHARREQLSPENIDALRLYTGRGGIVQTEEDEEGREQAITDESRKARNEHYTAYPVIESVWDALSEAGAAQGQNFLEPGCGIGNFAGFKPPSVDMLMVEMHDDPHKIAEKLYPRQEVLQGNLARTEFDAYNLTGAVGNVPFGNYSVHSKRDKFADVNPLIHDYFILRSLDAVMPGGVVALITSTGTMDKVGRDARRRMIGYGHFLGAFRLPSQTFKANADTLVTTDLVFFQKRRDVLTDAEVRVKDLSERDRQFLETTVREVGTDQDGELVESHLSRYYDENPGQMLGRLEAGLNSAFQTQWGVEGNFGATQAGRVRSFDLALPEALPEPGKPINRADAGQKLNLPRPYPSGAVVWHDGQFWRKGQKRFSPYEPPEQAENRTRVACRVLDKLKDFTALLAREGEEASEDAREDAREELLGYIDQFGLPAEDDRIREGLKRDPRLYKMLALAKRDDETGEVELADIFDAKRVYNDNYQASLAEEGSIAEVAAFVRAQGRTLNASSIKRVWKGGTESLEATREAMRQSGEFFQDPESGTLVHRYDYLAGELHDKIEVAEDAGLTENVEALTETLPEQASVFEIDADPKHVFTYLPVSVLRKWLRESLSDRSIEVFMEQDGAGFGYVQVDGAKRRENTKAGFGGKAYTQIAHAYINGQTLSAVPVDEQGNPKDGNVKDLDPAEEARAYKYRQFWNNKMLREIPDDFRTWLRSDASDDVKSQVEEIYNRKFNSYAPPPFDGETLRLEGMSDTVFGDEDFEVYEHNRVVVEKMLWNGGGGDFHDVGAGKAQPLDAGVLTPEGFRPMGDLEVGDEVISQDGKPTAVTGVFPQGEKTIYRVHFSDGSSTECCDEHLWLTRTYKERNYASRCRRNGKDWDCAKPKVRSLEEIKNTLEAPHLGAKNHSVPMVDPVEHPEKDYEVDPYTLGVMIGDGYLPGYRATPSLASGDDGVVERFKTGLPSGVSMQPKREEHTDTSEWYITRNAEGGANAFTDALEDLDLRGLRSESKFIPERYLLGSVRQREALLQGLMDADGTVGQKGHNVTFTTVSERLAEDMQALVQSLGGTAGRAERRTSYTHNGEKRDGALSYRLTVSLPPEIEPFHVECKASRVVPKSTYRPARYITDVEEVGQKEAQCIRVAAESSLYVTEDYLVTHNTLAAILTTQALKQRGEVEKPMIVVPGQVLEKWAAEYVDVFPDAKIMKITLGEDTAEELAAAQLFDWDAILIPQYTYKSLPLSPQESRKRLKKQVAHFQKMANEKYRKVKRKEGKSKANRLKNRLEARIEDLITELQDLKERETEETDIFFDELGVDCVIMDEAHAYKNALSSPRAVDLGIAAGDVSQRALDALHKARFIHDKAAREEMRVRQKEIQEAEIEVKATKWKQTKKRERKDLGPKAKVDLSKTKRFEAQQSNIETPERSHVFCLTATPVKNSPIEIWHMMNLCAPRTMEEFGISSLDRFIDLFVREEQREQRKISGEYQSERMVAGYVNLPEMRRVIDKACDVKSYDQLKKWYDENPTYNEEGERVEIFSRPPHSTDHVMVPPSDMHEALFEDIEHRAEIIKAYMGEKDMQHEYDMADNFLVLTSDGSKIALDLRAYSDEYGGFDSEEESLKVRSVARKAGQHYRGEIQQPGRNPEARENPARTAQLRVSGREAAKRARSRGEESPLRRRRATGPRQENWGHGKPIPKRMPYRSGGGNGRGGRRNPAGSPWSQRGPRSYVRTLPSGAELHVTGHDDPGPRINGVGGRANEKGRSSEEADVWALHRRSGGEAPDDGPGAPVAEELPTAEAAKRRGNAIAAASASGNEPLWYDEAGRGRRTPRSAFASDLDETTVYEPEHAQSTQRASTRSTYEDIGAQIIQDHGPGASVVDFGGGLGAGAEKLREMGLDVTFYEPYPRADVWPDATELAEVREAGPYDAVVLAYVLNVVPQGTRDEITEQAASLLADEEGSGLYVTTRADTKHDVGALKKRSANTSVGEGTAEYVVASTGSYQKGFAAGELRRHLEDVLGTNGYEVSRLSAGKRGAVARKREGQARENPASTRLGEAQAADPSNHVAHIREADGRRYEGYRRLNNEWGDGIDVLYGLRRGEGPRGGKTEVVALYFSPARFSTGEVRDWLAENEYGGADLEEASSGRSNPALAGEDAPGPDDPRNQIIFCDTVNDKTGANYHKRIKALLVEEGIPEREIAIVSGQLITETREDGTVVDADVEGADDKPERKFDVQERFNRGEYRVIIGNSAIAEGMNLDEWGVATHHMDVPYTPSEIRQRNGRMVRQGNNYDHVQIYFYLMEGSFDEYRLQLVSKKAAWIDELFDPQGGSRESTANRGGERLEYEEMMAATADNPDVKRYFEAKNNVERLSMETDTLRADLGRVEKAIAGAEQQEAVKEEKLDALRGVEADVQDAEIPPSAEAALEEGVIQIDRFRKDKENTPDDVGTGTRNWHYTCDVTMNVTEQRRFTGHRRFFFRLEVPSGNRNARVIVSNNSPNGKRKFYNKRRISSFFNYGFGQKMSAEERLESDITLYRAGLGKRRIANHEDFYDYYDLDPDGDDRFDEEGEKINFTPWKEQVGMEDFEKWQPVVRLQLAKALLDKERLWKSNSASRVERAERRLKKARENLSEQRERASDLEEQLQEARQDLNENRRLTTELRDAVNEAAQKAYASRVDLYDNLTRMAPAKGVDTPVRMRVVGDEVEYFSTLRQLGELGGIPQGFPELFFGVEEDEDDPYLPEISQEEWAEMDDEDRANAQRRRERVRELRIYASTLLQVQQRNEQREEEGKPPLTKTQEAALLAGDIDELIGEDLQAGNITEEELPEGFVPPEESDAPAKPLATGEDAVPEGADVPGEEERAGQQQEEEEQEEEPEEAGEGSDSGEASGSSGGNGSGSDDSAAAASDGGGDGEGPLSDERFEELKEHLSRLAEEREVSDREGSPYATLRASMVGLRAGWKPLDAEHAADQLQSLVDQLDMEGVGASDEERARFIRQMAIEWREQTKYSSARREGSENVAAIEEGMAEAYGITDTRAVAPPDTEMPVGKYEGQSVAQIVDEDRGYAQWAARELTDKPALRRAFAEAVPDPDEVEALPLDTEMPFGKYQGLSVRELVEEDPDYAGWASRKANDPALRKSFDAALAEAGRENPPSGTWKDALHGNHADEGGYAVLGFAEKLTTDLGVEATGSSGDADAQKRDLLVSNDEGTLLLILPPSLWHMADESEVAETTDQARRLYEQWHGYAPDGRRVAFRVPFDASPKSLGEADRLRYASDKIMQRGDRPGDYHDYYHDHDANLRPVWAIGDDPDEEVIAIENLEIDRRGVLN